MVVGGILRYFGGIRRHARRMAVAVGVAGISFVLMASRPPAETLYTVRVHDGTSRMELLSEPMTIQQRLLESRIRLSRYDEVTPSLSTMIGKDVDVQIRRGGHSTVHVPAEWKTPGEKVIASDRILAGRRIKIRSGRASGGGMEGTKDVVAVGEGRRAPRQKIFHMFATAYSPDIRDCWPYSDGITAIGLKAGYGVAAVDPRVIPLGSRIYVEGYGYAIAADVGGAIRGWEIDLCFDTHNEAKQYGRRRAKVYLLD